MVWKFLNITWNLLEIARNFWKYLDKNNYRGVQPSCLDFCSCCNGRDSVQTLAYAAEQASARRHRTHREEKRSNCDSKIVIEGWLHVMVSIEISVKLPLTFSLDFSQISFICLIAWFALAGLIRLKGLPDIKHSLISGWEGVPDLTEQNFFILLRKPGNQAN